MTCARSTKPPRHHWKPARSFPRAEGYAKKYLSQEPEGEEPDNAEAHRLLGLLFEREGRKGDARTEIQTALHLRPNFKAAKDDLEEIRELIGRGAAHDGFLRRTR